MDDAYASREQANVPIHGFSSILKACLDCCCPVIDVSKYRPLDVRHAHIRPLQGLDDDAVQCRKKRIPTIALWVVNATIMYLLQYLCGLLIAIFSVQQLQTLLVALLFTTNSAIPTGLAFAILILDSTNQAAKSFLHLPWNMHSYAILSNLKVSSIFFFVTAVNIAKLIIAKYVRDSKSSFLSDPEDYVLILVLVSSATELACSSIVVLEIFLLIVIKFMKLCLAQQSKSEEVFAEYEGCFPYWTPILIMLMNNLVPWVDSVFVWNTDRGIFFSQQPHRMGLKSYDELGCSSNVTVLDTALEIQWEAKKCILSDVRSTNSVGDPDVHATVQIFWNTREWRMSVQRDDKLQEVCN